MKRKKKSFYFKDYTESKIPEQNFHLNIIKVSFSRITFLSFVFLSILAICTVRIFYLSLSAEKSFYSKNIKENLLKRQNKYKEEMDKISQRLKNKDFIQRAPKDIVQQEKTNYSNLNNDIKKISLTIESL